MQVTYEMVKAMRMENNSGMTLKNGELIEYKSGWQVADYGKDTRSAYNVMKYIAEMDGTCGIWYSDGRYYVDHSFRVDTKKEALEIGRKHNQISVFGWKRKNLAYC